MPCGSGVYGRAARRLLKRPRVGLRGPGAPRGLHTVGHGCPKGVVRGCRCRSRTGRSTAHLIVHLTCGTPRGMPTCQGGAAGALSTLVPGRNRDTCEGTGKVCGSIVWDGTPAGGRGPGGATTLPHAMGQTDRPRSSRCWVVCLAAQRTRTAWQAGCGGCGGHRRHASRWVGAW